MSRVTFFKKMKNTFRFLTTNFKEDNRFSTYYALLRLLFYVSRKLHFKKLSHKLNEKRNEWIFVYLRKQCVDVISDFKSCSFHGEHNPNSPIWICWWTGEDTAPELVKQCIKSIRKNSGNHPINFIDKTTYTKFISIPDYITKKVENGSMGLAHLSDYIRISLLEKYGGLWLDATIFCLNEIPESYFDMPFFTCKSERQECGYISEMRWCTFVIGGWKNNVFFKYIKAMLESYWKKNNYAIDYLFFDYIIEIANQENKTLNHLIDNVPITNIHRDALQASMNKAVPGYEFYNTVNRDTVLYKLSWREKYSSKTSNGEQSIYDFFIKSDLSSLCL